MKKKSRFVGYGICLLGAIFYLYEYILRIEPSVMVTQLMHQFHIHASSFGFVTGLFYYAYTPMQLVVGILIDKYGTRIMMSLAIITCAVGSLLFGISYTVGFASFSRFLIGFGSSFAFVGVLKLAAEWLPRKYFAMFSGITTALGMLGGMFGDISLISVVEKIGWRKTQLIGTIIGFILIPIIFFFVKDRPVHIEHEDDSFEDMFINLKQMIKSHQMWICGFIGSALYLSLSAFAELWGIKFLEISYNLTAKMAGVACSMVFFGWLFGGPINGFISDKIGSRKIPLMVGGFLSAFIISIIICKMLFLSFHMLCIFLFLFGFFASSEVICFAINKEVNPHKLAGTAVALTNFFVMVGGMIFQPLLGFLLDFHWSGQMTESVRSYSALDYQKAFVVIPIVMFLSAIFAFFLKENKIDV